VLQNIEIQSNAVRVRFESDGSVRRSGFMIKFEVVEQSTPPPVGEFVCGSPAITPRIPTGAQSLTNSIVGGQAVIPNSHPWQVALTTQGGSQYCGGSIVHPQWVITAAHCVNGDTPSSVWVRAGMHNKNSDTQISANRVVDIIVHPQYNSQTTNNDIALLKLQDQLTFTDTISPACVNLGDDPTTGDIIAVTGWGTLSSGGSSSATLQEVAVPVDDTCGNYSPASITDAMICAGEGGVDSCQGDSGGPLIEKKSDNKYYLVGIVSWGRSCAAEGFPGVYSRVSHFRSFITQYISNLE